MHKKYYVSGVLLLLATTIGFAGELSSSTVYQGPRMSVETLLNLVGQRAVPSNVISEKEREANDLIVSLVGETNDRMLEYLKTHQEEFNVLAQIRSNSLVYRQTPTVNTSSSTSLPVVHPNSAYNGMQNQHAVASSTNNKSTKRRLSGSGEEFVGNKNNRNDKKAKRYCDPETICDDCGVIFVSKIGCRQHKQQSKSHKKVAKYLFICNKTCKRRFATLAEMEAHASCDLTFSQLGGVQNSRELPKTVVIGDLTCAPCGGLAFASQHGLARHQKTSKTHKEIMKYPFVCNKNCKRRFKTPQELSEHACTALPDLSELFNHNNDTTSSSSSSSSNTDNCTESAPAAAQE